jgi:RNA polymerase-binding transcription factor DksA
MQKRSRTAAPRRKSNPRAGTSEVIDPKAVEQKVPQKWRKAYGRLQQLRDQFTRSQASLNNAALSEQPAYGSHIADAATDNFDQELALGMLSAEQDAVYEIDEALERIRNGSYGTCEITGKQIEPERLDAIPWTRFSSQAQKTLEREGVIKKTKI